MAPAGQSLGVNARIGGRGSGAGPPLLAALSPAVDIYGVEAATAAIDYAFDVLGWTEVIHCIDPDNVPSQRLAERLGSRNLGPTQLPPPFDAVRVDRWGQSRDEWRARAR